MKLTAALSLILSLAACSSAPSPALLGQETTTDPPGDESAGEAVHGDFVLTGVDVIGIGVVDIVVREGTIVSWDRNAGADLPRLDATGKFIAPAFIDSHVHLAYRFSAAELAAGGVAAAVDLAAPLGFIAEDHSPMQLLLAGPMVTAVRGYPTQSWGADGYGAEVQGEDAARKAVDRLADAGAGVIKVPVGHEPVLTDEELATVVTRAHQRGLKVAAHALTDGDALRAAQAGADVLAHTPVETLSEETVAAWGDKAVITTLDAFGGGDAVANLIRLREAGATVLYGTDLGNTSVPAIDHNELELLDEAGLDGAAVLAAGTSVPAEFWGFTDLGTLRIGAPASLLVLDADPRQDPLTLPQPSAVYIDGVTQPHPATASDDIAG